MNSLTSQVPEFKQEAAELFRLWKEILKHQGHPVRFAKPYYFWLGKDGEPTHV